MNLTIEPKNVTPKGLWKYMLIIFFILSFFGWPVGIIFTGLFGYMLFVFPNYVRSNYPKTFTLTDAEIIGHGSGGKILWRVPWSDIESIYIVSYGWAAPKSLALRLRSFSNLYDSMEKAKSQVLTFRDKGTLIGMSRHVNNKFLRNLFGLKADILLHFYSFDRPALEMADLLCTRLELYS
jgi:hypothetical protein